MTDPQPHSSDGFSPLYTSTSSGLTYRRTSYASVAAGTVSSRPDQAFPSTQAVFSNSMNPTPTPPPPSQQARPNHSASMSHPLPDHQLSADGEIDVPETWGRAESTSNHPSQHYYGHGKAWPGLSPSELPGFFTPTYLRGSRYMEKLESAYRSKLASQRDNPSSHSSHPHSLSTSSSSVSLHKMAPSHRGITYEIIERLPPPEDEGVPPLPSKWKEVDKHGGLEISADGLDVKHVGLAKMHDHEAVAARADQPMPPESGLYYFEVTIISKGKEG